MENSWKYEFESESQSCFEQLYRCYSICDHSQKCRIESGDKILLPVSALDRLSQMKKVQYPLLFRLQNPKTGRVSHCGVMEFSSDEGEVWLPEWMMNSMGFQEGGLALINNANLVKGRHIKLQPHRTDFIRLSDPKAVLESTLRGFSCLTAGDTIAISTGGDTFYIDVLETKPSAAICIIDTDCEVDFAPPLDYEEPEKPVVDFAVGRKGRNAVFASSNVGKLTSEGTVEKEEQGFQAFTGKSYRL